MIRFAVATLVFAGFFNSVLSQSKYTYDEKGRVTKDQTVGIEKIIWNNQNKIVELIHADTSHRSDVQFFYDVNGNRVSKLSKPRDGKGLLPENTWLYTYFTYNVGGNLVATYERKYDQVGNGVFNEIILNASQVVGNEACLGYVKQDDITQANSFSATVSSGRFDVKQHRSVLSVAVSSQQAVDTYRGNTRYELNNHQQTVTAVVNDRKIYAASPTKSQSLSEITFAADYYPYGMMMPAREQHFYKYGFNGMERLNSGNDYVTVYRVFDTRIARWTSTDPKVQHYPQWSPYVAMIDNPIRYGDHLGDEPIELSFMQRVRSFAYKWPRTYSMLRIVLDLNSKFSTVDEYGEWKPKVPMHSTPRIPEEFEKSQKKRNKVANNNNGRTPKGVGGPNPLEPTPSEQVPESGTRRTAGAGDVAENLEATGSFGKRGVSKRLLKFIPIVGIGVEVAAAPEGQHPLETGTRILIGEAPAIGDLLLIGADYLAQDHEPAVPPKIAIVRLDPVIPPGLTPEQYYNIQKSLELDSAIPEEVTWHFPTQPSLHPKLQQAVDELVRQSK